MHLLRQYRCGDGNSGSTNYVVKIHNNKNQNKLCKLTCDTNLSWNDFTLWKIIWERNREELHTKLLSLRVRVYQATEKSVLPIPSTYVHTVACYCSAIATLVLYFSISLSFAYFLFLSLSLSLSHFVDILFWFFLSFYFVSFKQNMSSWTFSSHLKWRVPSFSIQ